MSEILGNVYSAADSMKRRIVDALRNPQAKLEQVLGDANDRARSWNEADSAALDEILATGKLNGPKMMGQAMALAQGYNPAGVVAPSLARSLPLKDYGEGFTRFSKPLPKGEMYREVNAEGLADLFKGNIPFGAPKSFFAEVPEMALGQGNNKGVMFKVESEGLKGRPHFGKPMLDQAFLNKSGEFEMTAQPTEIAKNMREVWVSPEGTKGMSKGELMRFKSLIEHLRKGGVKVNEVDALPNRIME